jgi:hypothetical protein
MMLKNKLFLLSIILLIASVSMGQDRKKKDLNPNYSKSTQVLGGVSIEGSLRISIYDDGDMQIARYFSGTWQNQWYGTNSKSIRLYADGSAYIGSGGYFSQNSPLIMTTISNSLSDANTSVLVLEYANKVRITQTINYPPGASYYDEKWEIQNISGGTLSDMRFFTGGDTYLYGGDNAAGFWTSENNVIGCQKMVNANEQQNLYLQGISIPYAYESQNYYGVYQSICNGQLTNTIDPNEYTDNGMALEWRKTNLSSGQTWTIDAVEKFILKTLTNVEVSAPLSAQVIPSGYADLVFSVSNRTSSSTVVSLNTLIDLSGWSAVIQSPSSPFTLAGNGSQEVIVRVSCPSGATLGSVAKVTLQAGDASGTASDFSNVEAAQVPSVTSQPQDVNLCSSSGSASFSITANNADSYEWQEYTSTWSSISNGLVFSGATTNSLTIANVSGKIGNQYRCRVINSYGSVFSSTAGIQGDEVDPLIPVLADLTGECSATASAPTTTDNCSGTITGTTSNPLIYTTQGNYTITWTFDDGNENSISVNQSVIIDDVTNPVPDVETLNTVSADCSVTVSEIPTATDNCAGTINGVTTNPLTYSENGTYTITWVYNDGNGNSTSQTQTVIIDDHMAPIPDIESLNTITAECSVTVSTVPTASDNCAGTINGLTSDPLTYSENGIYTITWLYNDGNGNSTTQTQTVVIDDNTAPVPDTDTLNDITAECSVTVSEIPTATDNCTGSINGFTSDPLTYSENGIYTILWVFNDGNGNATTQTQTVVIDDNTAPVPDNETLNDITAECSVSVTEVPTATDNCVGTINGVTSDPLFYNENGTYTITWVYDDGYGNTSGQTQTVVIDDNSVPPVPDLEILNSIYAECSVTVTEVPTATDNCVGTVSGITSDPLTYSENGTYTITWVYDDGYGNSSSQSQTVVIEDNSAPIPDLETLTTITAECSVNISEIPTATDNCAGIINGVTTDPLFYNEKGAYAITWTYDDGNGNSTTQIQNIVIDDNTAPVPDVEILDYIIAECYTYITTIPTATDDCIGEVNAFTQDPMKYNEQGEYQITWIYEDENGNTSSQIQKIIIEDITMPSITCVELFTINLTEGENGYTVSGNEFDPLTVNDNCNVASIVNDYNLSSTLNGAVLPVGTTSVLWTVTDDAGNFETCTCDILVNEFVGMVTTGLTNVKVFPNPANDFIKIKITEGTILNVILKDGSGKILAEKAGTGQMETFDLSEFPSGIYFISIITNKQLYTTKFMKN